MKDLEYLDSYELLCHLLRLDPDDDNTPEVLESKLCEEYEIENIYALDSILTALLPYCDRASGSLSGLIHCGFGDKTRGLWLMHRVDPIQNL